MKCLQHLVLKKTETELNSDWLYGPSQYESVYASKSRVSPERGRHKNRKKNETKQRHHTPSSPPPPSPPPKNRREKKNNKKLKAKRKKEESESEEDKPLNPTGCKHFKHYKGNVWDHSPPKIIPHSKCNYNPRYKGWRPEYLFQNIGINYKPYDECDSDSD